MESFDTQASSKLFLWVRNQVLEMTADFLTTQREGGGNPHFQFISIISALYLLKKISYSHNSYRKA